MAAEALTAFLRRDFTRTHQILITLTSDTAAAQSANLHHHLHQQQHQHHYAHHVSSPVDDPRIKHNALVARFYADPSQSNVEALLHFVSSFIPVETRPTTAADFIRCVASDPTIVKTLYTHVGAVALYNVAVVAYHSRCLDAAVAVGDILFERVEAMDEWLALAICFLLTDLHLRLSNVSMAATTLSFAENLLPSFVRRTSHRDSADDDHDLQHIQQQQQQQQQQHDTIAELPALSPSWSGRRKAILERPTSYEHAKFCMHIYNARLNASGDSVDVGRNIRKDAKQAILAADDAQSRPTSAALLVKARVESTFSKGLRILDNIISQCPNHMLPKVRPLALNSLGVLHHRLGRHALATCYFDHSRRAFDQLMTQSTEDDHRLKTKQLARNHSTATINNDHENRDDGEEDNTPGGHDDSIGGGGGDGDDDRVSKKNLASFQFSVLQTAKDTHVAYNLALQYMKVGDYIRALGLFSKCARADAVLAARSPVLWIRMAECCVGMECSGRESRSSLSFEGRGRSRRMIMRASESPDVAGMEYAACCARAALTILDERRAASSLKDDVNTASVRRILNNNHNRNNGTRISTRTPSPSRTGDDRDLRGTAWTLIAYASLSFDAQAVIDACDHLQQLYPKSEHERWTLAQLYAAEAYCMLRRPKDAAKRLAPLLSATVPLESDVREAAYVNMALTHACGEDLVTASRAARVALKMYSSGSKRHRYIRKQAMFAASYIFLRNGDTEAARDALRFVHNPSAE